MRFKPQLFVKCDPKKFNFVYRRDLLLFKLEQRSVIPARFFVSSKVDKGRLLSLKLCTASLLLPLKH
jgi:hypothetical protein